MRNQDELEGKARELKGKAKQAVGDVTDNERLVGEGMADEVTGKAQSGFGKAKRKAGETLEELGDDLKR